MMSASCDTEIASMRAAVGEEIVGRQRNSDGRTAFQLYIYDDDDDDDDHFIIDKYTSMSLMYFAIIQLLCHVNALVNKCL